MAIAVHVGLYDTLADWELGYVTTHINNGEWHREPGRYQIVTVGTDREPITTMGGMRITPDTALDEISPSNSAMLILPGAANWMPDGNKEFAHKAAEFLAAGTPVAAICGATAGLASAGLLDDRAHTSDAAEFLAMTGYAGAAHYRDEPAVADRGLITATGISPVAFAREIFALLEVYEPAVLAAWYKLYGLNDPAGYHELMGAE
ncbi:MAG: type 1 glutamine amidotransferase family protein [Stackebrandtia sp.]